MRFLPFVHGICGALAAMSFGMGNDTIPKPEPLPPGGHDYRKKGRTRSGDRSGQHGSNDRLILDRSSTVRKTQRWLNNGSLSVPDRQGSTRHLQRHGWYQRQLRKEADARAKV